MKNYIISERENADLIAKKGGGKAYGLSKVVGANLPCAPFIVLSSDFMKHFLVECQLEISVNEDDDFDKVSKSINEKIMSAKIPLDMHSQLFSALSSHGLNDQYLAVRSSGLDEDSLSHSFAGQFESFLYQRSPGDIVDSVKKCMASAYSSRCLSYRKANNMPLNDIQMAIVIQKMIDSSVSGVSFSRNPVSPTDRDNMIIDSVYGLGEGLVSGRYDADSYLVSRAGPSIVKTIASKTHKLVNNLDRQDSDISGLVEVEVLKDIQERSSLTDNEISQIKDYTLKMEEFLGCAVDLEWGIERDQLYILQVRPITNLPIDAFFDSSVNGDYPSLWDNSNIVESYSGVTSPLTFSFASFAYRQVYIQFCQVMGVPATLIEENEATFRNMLGLVRGRIYYNLINWYKLILMLPGSSSNKDFMETMLGVKKNIGKENEKLFEFIKTPPKYSVVAKIKLGVLTIFRFLTIHRIEKAFKSEFNRFYDVAIDKNYRSMSLTELGQYYTHLNEKMLSNWKAPIINDYLCMVFFGVLKKLCAAWVPKELSETLQNDLISGEGDVLSTEPTRLLVKMAYTLKKDFPQDCQASEDLESEEISRRYLSRKFHQKSTEMMDAYLLKFGFRCVNELKLEEDDLFEDPSFAFSVIKNYLKQPLEKLQESEHSSEIRDNAEKVVYENIPFPKRLIFNWVLKHARSAVKRREDLRFDRTKIFGIARRIFRGIGHNLFLLKKLDEEKDVFFLGVEEIIAFIEGRSLTEDLRSLVEIRKSDFNSFHNSFDPPERFMSLGAAGLSFQYPDVLNDLDLLKSEIKVSDDPNLLTGTSCCPGKVSGKVLVAKTPNEAKSINGEILVTARTDPGWVPLYPSASGLLIERGSLLSHSAVVAREMGLPTIVGVTGGLLNRLKTGDEVAVDAGKGEIRIGVT